MAVVLPGVTLIDRVGEVKKMVQTYLSRPELPLAFDIETTGLDPRTGKIITLQFYQDGYPVGVVDARMVSPLGLADALSPLFDGRLLVLGHNLKFDFLWLMEKLAIYPVRCFDTFLAEQVIRGVGRSDAKARGVELGLKALAKSYLGVEMSKEERSWFIDLDQRPAWEQPLPLEQVEYAAADVRVLSRLTLTQHAELRDRGLIGVSQLEMRALPAIATIEQSGVRINVEGWRAFIAEKDAQAKEIESEAIAVFGKHILASRVKAFDAERRVYEQWEQAKQAREAEVREAWEQFIASTPDVVLNPWGAYKTSYMRIWREMYPNPGKPKLDTSPPNLSSPAQLMQAFTEMGVPALSTASDVLETLEDDHPEVKLLLNYRRANKFVTSFGESLLRFVTFSSRIHPEYVQIGASTGRMSCTRPNWQQVPSKGDGKRLRELVVASPGNVLLTADFSNIELRILADYSRDKKMLDLFHQGVDLHSYTARMMFGLGPEVDVAHEMMPGSEMSYRAVAKTINFGLVYGMSPNKLARTTKVSLERAKELFDAYFRLYPGVKTWLEKQKRDGFDHLYSTTLSGRKRYYQDPSAHPEDYRMLKARIQRQAMNTPIQGTSADITKLALVNLYHRSGMLQNTFDFAKIVAVVHDEIVLECGQEEAEVVADALREAMGTAARQYLTVVTLPPVEVVVSDHWSKE